MSTTLPSVRARVRVMLKEADNKHTSLGLPEVDNAIRNAYFVIQSKLPGAQTATDSAGTISAGADTFSLPTTSNAEYGGLVKIRLRSTGAFLIPSTLDEITAWREGNATVVLGVPQYFALWEDATQTVQGRCYPGAKVAEAYDLHKGILAADFDLTAMDSSVIALSRLGVQALVYLAAAELAATLVDEDLRLRRLNPGVVAFWKNDAEQLIYKEGVRLLNLMSAGRTQRWVR